MKTGVIFFTITIAWLGIIDLPAHARPVTYREAALAAEHHLSIYGTTPGFTLGSGREIENKGLLLAFVFELIPQGYIVTAASTELSPVVAYSYESTFGELNPGNPLFEMITADLGKKIKYLILPENTYSTANEHLWESILADDPVPEADPLFEQWPASGDGWLKTNWTQNPPYNNFCPMDPVTGTRSFAGCPATAMGQIMNFHSTTNNTHFDDSDDYYHNYAGRQYWIDDDYEYADFPSFPELNTYLDTLNAHYKANFPLSNDDKAAMTFACGVAARQVFTSQGSGTFGVDQAYGAYLRFGCSTVDLLDSTSADLYERLKQNIKDTLPAHLAIVDESWSTGHNVVVDGYNTDDYYHLNFGWGGSYNGWYLIPDEIPYELTVIEGVVVDILVPDLTGTDEIIALESNIYPNPATGTTFLNYTIINEGEVKISVYGISGDEILTYRLNDQAPGNYTMHLSLNELPAGIYFYTVQTLNTISSGKIIRIK